MPTGKDVLVLEAADGNEVMAIYAGPTIVARTPHGMLHVHAHEVIVATGAAEVHPVCPGNDLAGLVTARAAERLHAAGIDLGRAVSIGTPPADVPCERVDGRLVRFEGDGAGHVSAGRDGGSDDRRRDDDPVRHRDPRPGPRAA